MDFDTRAKPPVLAAQKGASWRDCFGLDYRSLALYRALIGMVIIFDMLDRWPDIYAWYSDAGVLSRENLLSDFWDQSYISVHMVNGSELFQHFLLLIQIISGFCLTVGFYTTTNCVLSWYLHVSQQIRNPLVLHNGDVYIRCYLFFSMFLPLGKVWSMDAWLKGKQRKQRSHPYLANICSVALLIMLSIVYQASFIHKWENAWQVWFVKGDATYYALSLRFFRRPMGDLLLALGKPMVYLMGQVVLWFEGLGPLFLFSPWKHAGSRMFAAFGIAALHLGFGWSMRLDVFYMTGVACPMAMLPSWFWDTAIPSVYRRFDRRRIFTHPGTLWYDKRSLTLANFFVHMGLHMNLKARFVDADVGDMEAPPGKSGLTAQCWLRYVNEESGYEFTNMQAVAECCRASLLLWPAYWLLTFPSIWQASDLALQLHSRTANEPRLPPVRRRGRRTTARAVSRFAKNAGALFFIWFCLAWNGGNLGFNSFPQSVRWIGLTTHLYQSWNMFCPPPQQDWHHRVIGVLSNNQTIDIMSDHGFIDWKIQNFTGWSPIPDLTTLYATNRWHKLWEGVTFGRPWNEGMKVEVGRYICREWNKRHSRASGHTLLKHEFHLLTTPTRLDGQVDPWRDEVIHSHSCF